MKRRKGYTLVELLVAFAIFAILIIPVSGMINSAIRGNKSSKEKLELVNIFNYAYESYLNGDVKLGDNNNLKEINYTDNKYKIRFEKVNQAEYQMKGIDYSSYDLVLKVDGNELQLWEGDAKAQVSQLEKEKKIQNTEKVKNRVFIKVTLENSAFKYEIKINKIRENDDETFTNLSAEVFDKNVSNPSGKLLIDVNNTDYNINFLIDGVYNGNDLIDRILTVDYRNKPSNVNLASVYPNVEFIEKTATNSLDKNQRVEYVKISIFKNSDLNNPLDEKIYEFSKIQK